MPALAIAAALRDARAGARAGAGGRGPRGRGHASSRPATSAITCCPPSRSTAALVEERPLAVLAGRPAARGGPSCFEAERPVAVLGTGGYASAPVVWWAAAAGHSHRDPGAERLSRARHPLAEPAGAPRLPGSAGGAALLRFGRRDRGVRHRQSDRAADARAAAARRWQAFGLDGNRPVRPGDRRQSGCAGAQPGGRRLARCGRADGMRCLIWVTGRGTYEEFAPLSPPAAGAGHRLPRSDGRRLRGGGSGVSRAGMITVAELCAWGLPSILIPLPTAAADHQTHNARVLAEAGRLGAAAAVRAHPRSGWARQSSGLLSDDRCTGRRWPSGRWHAAGPTRRER